MMKPKLNYPNICNSKNCLLSKFANSYRSDLIISLVNSLSSNGSSISIYCFFADDYLLDCDRTYICLSSNLEFN